MSEGIAAPPPPRLPPPLHVLPSPAQHSLQCFSASGVSAAPGKACQEIYQPAAAAEARAVSALVAAARAPGAIVPSTSSASSSESNKTPQAGEAGSSGGQAAGAAARSASASGAAGGERPAAAALSDEAKRFLRDEIEAEQRARNKEMADAMLSLE